MLVYLHLLTTSLCSCLYGLIGIVAILFCLAPCLLRGRPSFASVGVALLTKKRYAERVHVQIPLPKAAEIYFEVCGKIDDRNCMQSVCGIDKESRTHN